MRDAFAPLGKQNESASTLYYFHSWSRKSDLNRRPAAYKAAALPTELLRRKVIISYFCVIMK